MQLSSSPLKDAPARSSTELMGPPVPIELLEPASRPTALRRFPVQGGLVFPPGELPTATQGAIIDDLGAKVPSEQEPTGVWNDGSV